jgi:uncharacterized protein YndB with AHSA1/START domain
MEKPTKNDEGQVLEIVELFDATPERIFKAWTNREDFVSWYGPEGFTVPFLRNGRQGWWYMAGMHQIAAR